MAVLVGEQDHDGEAADDDALEDKEDTPQDDVEGHDARRPVLAFITTLSTWKTLECLVQIVQGHVGSLKYLRCLWKFKYSQSTRLVVY